MLWKLRYTWIILDSNLHLHLFTFTFIHTHTDRQGNTYLQKTQVGSINSQGAECTPTHPSLPWLLLAVLCCLWYELLLVLVCFFSLCRLKAATFSSLLTRIKFCSSSPRSFPKASTKQLCCFLALSLSFPLLLRLLLLIIFCFFFFILLFS